MRWATHGERRIYDSPWVALSLVDVELPDGTRFDHHVVRSPAPAVGCVIHDPERGVLLLWRHRFIPDVWGWEIPAGRVEAGETPADAAIRESVEETGWRPGSVTELTTYRSTIGLSDQEFGLYLSSDAAEVADPVDTHEAERIEWVPILRVRELILDQQIPDGLTLTALLWCLTHRLFSEGPDA